MSSETDLVDHARRIAVLEAQVAALTKRLGAADSEASSAAQQASGFTFESAGGSAGTDDPRIAELVVSGNKIEAIKLYRELTGVGLAEAKSAIDSM